MTDDSTLTDTDRKANEQYLDEFKVYLKKAEPFMMKMKKDFAGYHTKKSKVMQGYTGISNQLVDYENNNLQFYQDQDADNLVFALAEYPRLDDQLKQVVATQKNPFTDLYRWVKGESYDLHAFHAALDARKATA